LGKIVPIDLFSFLRSFTGEFASGLSLEQETLPRDRRSSQAHRLELGPAARSDQETGKL